MSTTHKVVGSTSPVQDEMDLAKCSVLTHIYIYFFFLLTELDRLFYFCFGLFDLGFTYFRHFSPTYKTQSPHEMVTAFRVYRGLKKSQLQNR